MINNILRSVVSLYIQIQTFKKNPYQNFWSHKIAKNGLDYYPEIYLTFLVLKKYIFLDPSLCNLMRPKTWGNEVL